MCVGRTSERRGQGHGELAAEVVAELVQPLLHGTRLTQIRRGRGERGLKSARKKRGADEIEVRLRHQSAPPRVDGVDPHARRHRAAVSDPIAAHLLQPMGEPVSEVERTSRAALERIAALHDVIEVKPRRTHHERLVGGRLARGESVGRGRDRLHETAVAHRSHLHGFGKSGAERLVRQCPQEAKVADDRRRDGESADAVFQRVEVDAVLDAHRAVALREHGGGHAHERDAAVEGRRRISRRVLQRAAADREPRVRAPHSDADRRGLEARDRLTAVRLQPLAARKREPGESVEFPADGIRLPLRAQSRERGQDGLLRHDEDASARHPRERTGERGIVGRETVVRERDRMRIVDAEGA